MVEESPFLRLRYPCLMGVVNVTPDSFSDGGRYREAGAAVGRVGELVREGAGMVDLGAEASSFFRAGVEAVPAGEQLRRLMPVLEGLRGAGGLGEVVISVDTRSAEVAEGVLRVWEKAGGVVINDVSAGVHEPELLRVVARFGAGIVLMHMNAGYPKTDERDDPDIVGTVTRALVERKRVAMAAGIAEDRIALDPGVGFGKTMADNWRLALAEWGGLGMVVLGVSRKRFLETGVPGDVERPGRWGELMRRVAELGNGEAGGHLRDGATAVVTAVAAGRGVGIHRVHNVMLAKRALAM